MVALVASFAVGFTVPLVVSRFWDPLAAATSVAAAPAPSALPSWMALSARSTPQALPLRGTGTFRFARGVSARRGTRGQLVRYQVAVEVGAGVDPDGFAAVVDQTLADPRGWTAGAGWSFLRVPQGADAALVIHLTTPDTTDRDCAQHGVRTAGEVSCRGGRDIYLNLRRWQLAVPGYRLAEYRHMVVNHEVGHFLGHGHVLCPAKGALAPIMQTQSISLTGCRPNAWPYPDGRTFLTGPLAPS